MQLFINNWASSLTLPATASAVQLSVPEADANRLTGLGTGDHYLLTLAIRDINGIETAWEVVRVTGHTAGVLDVLRGQEGTTALELEAATAISARLTQATMETLRDSANPALGDTAAQPLGAAAAGTSPAASRADHVHPMPTKADIGLGSVDNTSDAGKPVSTAQQTALDDKVDKVTGYGLSEEDYTTAEKSKLAGLESSRFKGLYATLGALQAAHPTAGAGDYADVDAGIGSDTLRYVWDVDDAQWILSGSGAPLTAAQVKTLYESNADTNAFTDSEKTKLGTVASNATANPDTDSLAESGTPTNKWFTEARVLATLLTGLSLATSTAVAATDNVLVAIGKLAARLALKEQTLTAGPNVTIDRTDPDNPIISASITGGGGGDVVGPASAVDNGVALFDGITGELIKDGGVLGSGAFSAAYVHPNHTGDVTSTGDGAQVITDNAVTNAKLADVATATIKGRVTAATGDPEDLTATQVRTLINVADGATANDTDANLLARANHTGSQATSTITGLDAALDKVKLQSITVACSDETTALTAGAGKVTFRMPYAFTLTGVRASLTTPQTGGSILTVDINESGTTILSTKLTTDNAEKTSTTAATAPVISDAALADDAEITVDIDQVGDGTAKGLKVTLIGYQP